MMAEAKNESKNTTFFAGGKVQIYLFFVNFSYLAENGSVRQLVTKDRIK